MNNPRVTIRRTIVLICVLSAGITQYSVLQKLQFTRDILSNGKLLFSPPGFWKDDVTYQTTITTTTSSSSSSSSHQLIDKSFQRAYEESLGFFDDVPEDEWMRRKKITLAQIHLVPQQPAIHGNHSVVRTHIRNAPAWYATNWHPDFHCGYEDFVGLDGGDGGKWVCDPHRLLQKDTCIVYSIGSNGKFDFEMNINVRLPHCEVHIFDFTDYSDIMTKLHVNASYHSWGLGSSSGKANVKGNKNWIFKSFRETVQELGHTGRTIDIFKIDCEECEWISYLDWFSNAGVEGIQQILLEAHYVPYPTAENMFQYLHDQGYVIFHKEPNIQFGGGNCVEFSFLRLNRTFFLAD